MTNKNPKSLKIFPDARKYRHDEWLCAFIILLSQKSHITTANESLKRCSLSKLNGHVMAAWNDFAIVNWSWYSFLIVITFSGWLLRVGVGYQIQVY